MNKQLFALAFFVAFSLPFSYIQAAPAEVEADAAQRQQELLQREDLRQQQQRAQWQLGADVRLESEQTKISASSLLQNEQPCFAIQQVKLIGEENSHFQFALKKALKQSHFQAGMCLGAQGVNQLMVLVQNAVIARGYITTRILAAPQELSSGLLELTVMPGRIHQVVVDDSNNEQTHATRIAAFHNKFPTGEGDILNLRHLEQGLENLKRLPTAEAGIQIKPSEKLNESDVVVSWQQQLIPYRVAFSADDSGSKATGKYQGSVTFSADNPFGLSDLFYAAYTRDLGHKDSFTDSKGQKLSSGTRSYNIHYSAPFGNWLWSIDHSHYHYHQAVAGFHQNYDYNGNSNATTLSIGRMFYRDARRKTNGTFKLWKRQTHSFIDDAEIDAQYRRTAGWALDLNHKEYIGNSILNLGLGYKRGTGGNGSLPAPEEAFGKGTSHMQIVTADISLYFPLAVGKQNFSYNGSWHGQWNKTPLTPQDKIAIGGRYTVRGFDGELSLSAERGWYWRNDLAWHYLPTHQAYLGLDGGHVSGPSTKDLLGQTLIGGAVGLKGQLKAGGVLSYDLFAGKPIRKPKYFQTDKTTYGFSLNYVF